MDMKIKNSIVLEDISMVGQMLDVALKRFGYVVRRAVKNW